MTPKSPAPKPTPKGHVKTKPQTHQNPPQAPWKQGGRIETREAKPATKPGRLPRWL